jgi:hypothetical protein
LNNSPKTNFSAEPPQDPQEEFAPIDDAIIGRAIRWSVFVLVFVGAAGAIAYGVLQRKPAPQPPSITALSAPAAVSVGDVPVPTVKFTDITNAAGIRFIHNTGAYGAKLLPETMGAGVAFFDFDNDADADLLFINGTYWPGHIPEGKSPTTMALYANDGRGNFSDVTAGSGLDVPLYGMGVAIGDYDNDGHSDVYVTGVRGNHLFHNEGGGKFRDVTGDAGVGGAPDGWSSSAAWIDFDRDGRLDLFVCNYVKWSEEIDKEVGYTLVGVGRAYGPPMNFQGAFPRLYHNEGNGRFSDVSSQAGIEIKNPATGVPVAKSLGVSPVDIDRDGWIDLVIANDTVQNFVFHNQRDGTFAEIGALSGVAFDSYGNTRGAMGIDSAYYRNDDTLGVAIGNFANEMTALYVAQPQSLSFADEAIAEGIGPTSRLALKFGVSFIDYDLDGWLDLLSTNGHLEEEITKVQSSQRYAQPAHLFWNGWGSARRAFVPVGEDKAGPDLFKPIVGRGSASADIDGDGDLDVVLTQAGGAPLLLRNDQSTGHHWLRLKLSGRKSNRDAIGALVKVWTGKQYAQQRVNPTRSYLSQSELPLVFGLGKNTKVDRIEIQWSDGAQQTIADPKIDGLTEIQQGEQ